jgi:periplasmic copper chaperone A
MVNEGMSIEITRPWIRTSAGENRQTGGFFTATNKGREADRLVAAASPAATKVEIHQIKVIGYGIRMRPMEKGLGLPPDTAITLKPRGYHLLFLELKAPLVQGQRVPVTLTFEKAGTQQIEMVVEPPGPVGEETLYEGQSG